MNYVEPKMLQIRPGLELCFKADPAWSEGYTPLVFSHRRAGTHLLGEFVSQHWGRDWLKSHDFPERLPIKKNPTFYVVRNPIDVIYETYVWWTAKGGAHNQEVADAISGICFSQYLEGKFAEVLGYQSWAVGDKDNNFVTRGMHYDPIRYWRDHYRAAVEAGVKIISYEDLVRRPRRAAELVAQVIGDLESYEEITAIPPVGMSPNIQAIGSHFRHWPEWGIEKVTQLNSPSLIHAAGFTSMNSWVWGKDN